MQRPTFLSSTFHYTFGSHAPSLRVKPGTRLRVTCPDSDGTFADGSRVPSPPQGMLAANPMAGPIFIVGAMPSDAIAVEIEAIELDRDYGQTLLDWGHGLLTPDQLVARDDQASAIARHMYRWKIDQQAGVAELENPLGAQRIAVKLDPFVGCIGTCPKSGQSISTILCGDFGGNMDLPMIRPGATIYLPVNVEGGLLMMGDIHAAQGEGEIIGGAIEISGKIDCTIGLIRGANLAAPRLRDPKRIATIASAGELRAGIQLAYSQLVNWLSRDAALNRFDAYNLVSQTATLRLGGLGAPPNAVAACMPLSALPDEVVELLSDRWRR